MTRTGALLLLVTVHAVAAVPGVARGELVDLGTLGGADSMPAAINDRGQVVGWSTIAGPGFFHAFLWESGTMQDLGTLGGSTSEAFDISETSLVVGGAETGAGYRAFLWQEGTMLDLGTLGGSDSRALAVNDAGQVMGESLTSSGEQRAFLWEQGTMRDLGTLGGGWIQPFDLSEAGQVVGESTTASGDTHAFLWDSGVMHDLGTLGGTTSRARAINALGQVVGESTTASGETHAFLWQAGVMHDLGTLGGATSVAYDVNDAGQVSGESWTGTMNEFAIEAIHAFLWEGGVMQDLGALPFFAAAPMNAFASGGFINELGDVAGFSAIGYRGYHAFLWDSAMHDLGVLPEKLISLATGVNDHGQVIGQANQPIVLITPRGFISTVSNADKAARLVAFLDRYRGELEGAGKGGSARARLRSLRKMLRSASELIGAGADAEACRPLRDASLRLDGEARPRDLASGPKTVKLRNLVENLRGSLGCR